MTEGPACGLGRPATLMLHYVVGIAVLSRCSQSYFPTCRFVKHSVGGIENFDPFAILNVSGRRSWSACVPVNMSNKTSRCAASSPRMLQLT